MRGPVNPSTNYECGMLIDGFDSDPMVMMPYNPSYYPDKAVAKALLDRAWQWLQKRGATVMRGPVNPSTNYECGMLIDGFDSDPMVMMPYNPRYYPELMTEAGLRKAKDLYAYASSVAGVGTGKNEGGGGEGGGAAGG